MGCRGRARHRDPVHAGSRRDAGLHRRALHRRPRHDARGRRRPRRRPEAGSTRSRPPRWSSTTRSSPTCSAPRTRSSATSRSSTSATASATSSCAGARRRSTTSRSSRRAPASCTRSTSSTSRRSSTTARVGGVLRAYPDTCVGTDSHTTMVNGLGVLGWGVGGIEAEAAMLGQPVSMLIPKVVGFKLSGAIPTGVTATDVVLTITEMLRKHGVVGKFVEFYGEGVASVPLANRATIGNMSPEFGSTAAMFPIDDVTLDYLRLTGRSERAGRAGRGVREGCRRSGTTPPPSPSFSEYLELDLSTVVPSIAGPKRPQDRIVLAQREGAVRERPHELRRRRPRPRRPRGLRVVPGVRPARKLARGRVQRATRTTTTATRPTNGSKPTPVSLADGEKFTLDHGAVTIAAITSCTNTSNPSVMLAAGLLARNAVQEGPQGQAVGQDHARARLEGRHRLLREGRPHQRPRGPRLLHGRLRLHDLHRQLRPAHRGGLGRDQRERPRRHRGALGQPQLRGSHQPRREDELPREPAARDRLLARRLDELRLRDRPARQGPGRQRRVPQGHLAGRGRGAVHDRLVDQQGHVHARSTRASSRATSAGGRCRRRPATSSSGMPSRPTCASPRTSTA